MKYHIGYKVVSGESGKWHSMQTEKLKYPELVPVKRPKGWGPLAVFMTLETAQNFAYRAVFKCLYTKSRARTWWRVMSNGTIMRSIQTPLGKDYADEVILIERVQ